MGCALGGAVCPNGAPPSVGADGETDGVVCMSDDGSRVILLGASTCRDIEGSLTMPW